MGIGATTEIKVEKGVVVERRYKLYRLWEESSTPKIDKWFVETGASIGSYKEGAPPLTMDQLYEECKSTYLSADTNNWVTFKSNSDGVLSACGYYPKNCMDDCFSGFTVTGYDWIK